MRSGLAVKTIYTKNMGRTIMSKAMDALNVLIDNLGMRPGGCPCDPCASCDERHKSLATLRDYITTTEAREAAWTIALAGEQLAHETDLTLSAARIKAAEEGR